MGADGACLGLRWSRRGAGNSDAGTCMTWLVSARMDEAGRPWALASSAHSVSCRCRVSSMSTRLVSGSTLRRTRNGRGYVCPVLGGVVELVSFVVGVMGEGVRLSTLGTQ